ncbi:MAG: ammonia-forming cytochrome c nitrite reductase [Bacteroidales bacterium]|nr:ammonia-forming cytochrome c nitrite reductase [Bacteroidales bacterium]
MATLNENIRKKPWLGWVIFLVTVVIVFFLGLLASSIMERRAEAVFAYTPQVNYESWEPRNAVWGKVFPREYQSYLQTADTTFRSKYNGAAMIDMLELYPRLSVLWAGYGFARDYNQGRGHYYAITDVRNTLRTGAPMDGKPSPQPNTCWACKSTDVPRMMQTIGIAETYAGTWETLGHEIVNGIGCADCHDAKTMNLRISRPALVEAFERIGKDITRASHQEMRSLVCAQCHVEYYFDNREGRQNYLTLPWDNGLKAEDMERYYDAINFSDWTHALSKAPMLKAQHPDWEVYMTGIHAERGVSCADCHMPYKSEGGLKFTDHHLQSPLNNVEASCAVCHREKTMTLIKNVYDRQDQIYMNRSKLEELLVRAHVEAKKAWDLGATGEQMQDILMGIRHSQWRWDYAAAGHGSSFHAPVETSRVIGSAINIAQETRIKLARLLASLGYNEEVPYPDISTKAKAQAFIGLDMQKLNDDKQVFLQKVIPVWDSLAAARESEYPLR